MERNHKLVRAARPDGGAALSLDFISRFELFWGVTHSREVPKTNDEGSERPRAPFLTVK